MDQKENKGVEIEGRKREATSNREDRALSVRRRRLLGGLLSAPILTLAAPPAMAHSCTASGGHSAFFASRKPKNCSAGYGCDYWKKNDKQWLSKTRCSPGTKNSGKHRGGGHNWGGGGGYNSYSTTNSANVMTTSSSSTTNNIQSNEPYTGGTMFSGAFMSGPRSFGGPISLMNVLWMYSSSPEAHWVTALLNAYAVPGYPYTPVEITKLWNDPTIAGPNETYVTIADFFRTYLE